MSLQGVLGRRLPYQRDPTINIQEGIEVFIYKSSYISHRKLGKCYTVDS